MPPLLSRLDGDLNLTDKDTKIGVLDFIHHLQKQSYSPLRVRKYETIFRLMRHLRINPPTITTSQVDKFFFHLVNNGYADTTKYDYWQMFRIITRFYKPKLQNTLKEYNNNKLRNRARPVQILEINEINQLINSSKSLRNQTMLMMLYEGGFRCGELRDISRDDVTFDKHGAIVLVNGKTGVRRVRIIRSAWCLKKLLEVNPKPFDVSTRFIYKTIDKLKKRCNITKRVYPHLFRHTRATHLAKVLTDRELCLMFGWRPDSRMPSNYVHLSFRDLDEKIISLQGT